MQNLKDKDGDSSSVGTSQRAGDGVRPVPVARKAKITPESQAEEAAAAGIRPAGALVGSAGFHRYMEAYVSMVTGGTAKYVMAFVLIPGDGGLFYLRQYANKAPVTLCPYYVSMQKACR